MSTPIPPRPEPDIYSLDRPWRPSHRAGLLILAVLALLLAAVLLAVGAASAGGPVLWKEHCPATHDVQIVPSDDWGGVHVLCVLGSEEAEKR